MQLCFLMKRNSVDSVLECRTNLMTKSTKEMATVRAEPGHFGVVKTICIPARAAVASFCSRPVTSLRTFPTERAAALGTRKVPATDKSDKITNALILPQSYFKTKRF